MKSSLKDIPRARVETIIKDFEIEIKENTKDIKLALRDLNYNQAGHLDSVNGCLDYVITTMRAVLLGDE